MFLRFEVMLMLMRGQALAVLGFLVAFAPDVAAQQAGCTNPIGNEGEFASSCFDSSNRQQCQNGIWAPISCGTDFCTDTGDTFGGGSCSATDFFCAAGSCGSVPASGTDTCGGSPDSPAVTYFVCSAGNTCVASNNALTDVCVDTGGNLGGGACSAVDWTCANGVLSKTESTGADTCGGTDDNPSVTFYSCQASDGNVADSCIAAPTAEADSCSDSGTTGGGGSCSANDWECAGGLLTSTTTSGTDICSTEAEVQYFACASSDGSVADRCIAALSTCPEICSAGECAQGEAVPGLGTAELIGLVSILGVLGYSLIRSSSRRADEPRSAGP